MERFDLELAGAFFGCIVCGTITAIFGSMSAYRIGYGLWLVSGVAVTGLIIGGVFGLVLAFLVAAVPQRHRRLVLVLGIAASSLLSFVMDWFLAIGVGHA